MKTLLAGAIDFDGIKKALPGLDPIFQPDNAPGVTAGKIGLIFNKVIPFVFVIAGLMLLFYLIAGGFRMMLGANDEKAIADGRAKITNALIGFLIMFVSYWIVQIMQFILGFKVL